MSAHLSLHIAEDGADAERLDALTGHLRRELLQLDVEDVTAVPGGPAPDGARVVDVAAVGALLVGLGSAAGSLNEVVTVVRGWLSRGDKVRRTVKIEIGGDTLELSEASPADQDRLIDIFVRQHTKTGASGDGPA